MARTNIRGAQIKDSDVGREDLNTATTGRATITKVIAGTGISLSSTGVDSGTGDVTVSRSGPNQTTATLTTSNATQQILATITPSASAVLRFRVELEARLDDTGVNKSYWASMVGGVRRNNGGSAVLVGTTAITDDNENSAYSCTVGVSGNDLQILITGAASESVKWKANIEYEEVT